MTEYKCIIIMERYCTSEKIPGAPDVGGQLMHARTCMFCTHGIFRYIKQEELSKLGSQLSQQKPSVLLPVAVCLIRLYTKQGVKIYTTNRMPLHFHQVCATNKTHFVSIKHDRCVNSFRIRATLLLRNPQLGPYWKIVRP